MFTMEDKINIVLSYIATDDKVMRKNLKSMAIAAIKDIDTPSDMTTAQTSTTTTVDVDDLIAEHLKQCGMPPHLIGYKYTATAIKLCLADPDYLRNVTKGLYYDIASQHNTTYSRTERAIRHAVEVVFDRGDMEYIISIFGFTMNINSGKLTNSEFIAGSANEITRQMKKLGISEV